MKKVSLIGDDDVPAFVPRRKSYDSIPGHDANFDSLQDIGHDRNSDDFSDSPFADRQGEAMKDE